MITKCFDEYSKYTSDMTDWLETAYREQFSEFFDIQHSLAVRLSSNRPITDDELEQIMLDIPLKLFSASEKLAQFQLSVEAIKLKIRSKECEIAGNLSANHATTYSEAKIKEVVSVQVSEDKIVLAAYMSLISRVERELSYSRELIMGAKKVWDSRRKTDASNPISESSCSEYEKLPDYVPKGRSYIR